MVKNWKQLIWDQKWGKDAPITVFMQYYIGDDMQWNKARKGNKIYKNWKGKIMSLFIDNVECSQESTDKLLQLRSEFIHVARYMVNIQKVDQFYFYVNQQTLENDDF